MTTISLKNGYSDSEKTVVTLLELELLLEKKL